MISRALSLVALVALAPQLVSAQLLGAFRWQLQPHCNIVTVAVTQSGNVFELEGTDDQCGGGPAASASGTAFMNPDGSVGFGLAIVAAPSGTPVHVEASISLSTLNGTWHDSTGASGPFVFTPGAGSGGNPRPPSLGLNLAFLKSVLLMRTPADDSIGMGDDALGDSGATAVRNTAFGSQALESLTTGIDNTAVGASALSFATSGSFNIAIGSSALAANTTGEHNLALGRLALFNHRSGQSNVAVGSQALQQNATGERNVAVGRSAAAGVMGSYNVAVGSGALQISGQANRNVAVGMNAMFGGGTGSDNVAVGHVALDDNPTGERNVIVGAFAFEKGQGSDNIMIGYRAGDAIPNGTAATNNIYIGSTGFSQDNNTIRIGNPTHAGTVIAGIANQTSVGGVPVLINAGGRMGTATSSVRFKTDIAPLGADARRLHELKPVRFVYKPEYDDGSRQPQFGLIAEEVATAFPELLVRDEAGEPWTVRYHLLTPLLLAEVQRLERARAALVDTLEARTRALMDENAELRARLERLEKK